LAQFTLNKRVNGLWK